MTTTTNPAPLAVRPVALPTRLLAAGAALAAVATGVALGGWSAWPLWIGLVAPDVTLAGLASPGLAKGRLDPRWVPAYNAAHSPLGPLALGVVALGTGGLGLGLAALGWAAHQLLDRASGYGLRGRDGWQRG